MRHEDDLRAALRLLERQAPDPDAVLNAVRARFGEHPGRHTIPGWPWRWRARRRPWMAPLAVVLAVIALAAGSAVAAQVRGHRVPDGTADGLPAYFLAFPGANLSTPDYRPDMPGTAIPARFRSHETVHVVSTATGGAVASATLPGFVIAITASSSGVFFAAVIEDHQARFYAIRLNRDHKHTTVRSLPIAPDTAPLDYLAASPDGSKLAYSTSFTDGALSGDVQDVVVASAVDGSQREWAPPQGSNGYISGPMNWLGDGRTLAFTWTVHGVDSYSAPSSGLRLLDTAAPGSDLLDSRVVLPLITKAGFFHLYAMSADRTAIIGMEGDLYGVTTRVNGHRVVPGSVLRFSAATKRPELLWQPAAAGSPGGCSGTVLWVSGNGQRVLADCAQLANHPDRLPTVKATAVALIDRGHVTLLPALAAVSNDVVAFPGLSG